MQTFHEPTPSRDGLSRDVRRQYRKNAKRVKGKDPYPLLLVLCVGCAVHGSSGHGWDTGPAVHTDFGIRPLPEAAQVSRRLHGTAVGGEQMKRDGYSRTA